MKRLMPLSHREFRSKLQKWEIRKRAKQVPQVFGEVLRCLESRQVKRRLPMARSGASSGALAVLKPSIELGKTPKFLGGLGLHFYLKFQIWKGQELRRIVPLFGELVTVNFHFPKIPKVIIFLIFGFSGNDCDPQKPLVLVLESPNYLKQFKKIQIILKHIMFWKSPNIKIRTILCLRKDACPTIIEICLISSHEVSGLISS